MADLKDKKKTEAEVAAASPEEDHVKYWQGEVDASKKREKSSWFSFPVTEWVSTFSHAVGAIFTELNAMYGSRWFSGVSRCGPGSGRLSG